MKKALKLHLISTSAKVNFRIGKNKIDSQFYRFFLSRRPELSGYSRVVKYINPHIIYIYIYQQLMVEMCKLLLFFSFFSLFFCLVSHFFHVLCSSLFWLFYYSRLHVSCFPHLPCNLFVFCFHASLFHHFSIFIFSFMHSNSAL